MNTRTPQDEPAESGEGDREVTPPKSQSGPDSLSSFLPRASLVREDVPVQTRSGVDVRSVAAVSLVLFTLVLVTLATAIVGAAGIERAERADQLAEQDLYGRIAAETTLLRHDFASERRAEMEALFSAVGRDGDPVRRQDDAARLVTLLTQEVRARQGRPLEAEEALRRDLEKAVRALRRLEQEAEARQRDVQAARGSLPGRLASVFGA